MSVFLKVDSVQIPVPDLDTGLAFYRDRLGHALTWRTATAAGLRLPESDTEIVLQTERPELEPNLLVASVDEAVGAFIAAGGSVVVTPFPIAIGRCAVVGDPWGNRLVLLDAGMGALVTDRAGHVVGVQRERTGGSPLPEDLSHPLPGIVFQNSAEGLTPDRLGGFFAGWRRAVTPAEHLSILRGSAAVAVAIDPSTERVVGFVTAISDGVLCAHITLLEVLPAYRGRGIGRALVRRMMDQFRGLYAIDTVCDPQVLPFYEVHCGMRPAVAAIRRQY